MIELAGQIQDDDEHTHNIKHILPATDTSGSDESENYYRSSSQVSSMISQVDRELSEDFGQLVVGKDGSIRIGKEFWTVFCSEVIITI